MVESLSWNISLNRGLRVVQTLPRIDHRSCRSRRLTNAWPLRGGYLCWYLTVFLGHCYLHPLSSSLGGVDPPSRFFSSSLPSFSLGKLSIVVPPLWWTSRSPSPRRITNTPSRPPTSSPILVLRTQYTPLSPGECRECLKPPYGWTSKPTSQRVPDRPQSLWGTGGLVFPPSVLPLGENDSRPPNLMYHFMRRGEDKEGWAPVGHLDK